jgi:hypothetical protein
VKLVANARIIVLAEPQTARDRALLRPRPSGLVHVEPKGETPRKTRGNGALCARFATKKLTRRSGSVSSLEEDMQLLSSTPSDRALLGRKEAEELVNGVLLASLSLAGVVALSLFVGLPVAAIGLIGIIGLIRSIEHGCGPPR